MTKDESTEFEFNDKSRSIKYRENRRVCEKGNYETYGYARGNQFYSTGIHHIRIKFEKIRFDRFGFSLNFSFSFSLQLKIFEFEFDRKRLVTVDFYWNLFG